MVNCLKGKQAFFVLKSSFYTLSFCSWPCNGDRCVELRSTKSSESYLKLYFSTVLSGMFSFYSRNVFFLRALKKKNKGEEGKEKKKKEQ